MTTALSKARLKSAELMGLYLLFSQTYDEKHQNSDLFSLFVKYYGRGFKADISELKMTRGISKSDTRLVTFNCPLKKYQFNQLQMGKLPSLAGLCRQNYMEEPNVFSADLLLKYSKVSAKDQLKLLSHYLSRQNAPLSTMSKCYGLDPGVIFEISLFSPHALLTSLNYELRAETDLANLLTKRLLLTDLITVSPGFQTKDDYYKRYLDVIRDNDELLDDILLFAAKHVENTVEPLDVFDALQRYPGALNMNLFSGSNGDLFNNAVFFFNKNEPDSALTSLRESINFNGVTPEKTRLTAAVFRLLNENEKSLSITLHSAFNGLDKPFVSGNLYLNLKALKYTRIDELKNFLATEINCDSWSKTVITEK